MPVTQTALTSGFSGTNASSYTTDSITPSADKLIRLAVASRRGSNPPATPTVSGNGLTWVQIATVAYNVIGTEVSRLTTFRAMGASPSSGQITIDFGGETQTSCCWSVSEFGNVDTGGTNGSAAVVQSATNRGDDNTGTVTVTLGAFSSADNATDGAFAQATNDTFGPGTGFTEIHDVSAGAGEANALQTEWRSDNDTSVDSVLNDIAYKWAGIAMEIKFASAEAFISRVVII